jgi:hypothetical protein
VTHPNDGATCRWGWGRPPLGSRQAAPLTRTQQSAPTHRAIIPPWVCWVTDKPPRACGLFGVSLLYARRGAGRKRCTLIATRLALIPAPSRLRFFWPQEYPALRRFKVKPRKRWLSSTCRCSITDRGRLPQHASLVEPRGVLPPHRGSLFCLTRSVRGKWLGLFCCYLF